MTGNTIAENIGDGITVTNYGNVIGTTDPGGGNTITGNAGSGVVVDGIYNSIRGNVINSNGGLAIDLGNDGRTPNDSGDFDYGPNDLQNYPVITSLATGAVTRVTGKLNSWPNSNFTIDIYAQAGSTPVNPGSSARYLGSFDVITDESGNASFDVMLDAETFTGELVSATATDMYGNTSEFSDFSLIQVSPVAGLYTSEGGAQASFSVVLALEPTDDVLVPLTSSDPTEGSVSPAVFVFTPENWNVPQVATITGLDDTIADGPVSYDIVTDPAVSADARFDGYEPDDVQVVNYDNDFAAQTAIQPFGSLIYSSTLEGVIGTAGQTESYMLLLDPGQTLTVLVEPSESLRASIEVYDPAGTRVGSATSVAAGLDAFVQTLRIPGQIAGNGGTTRSYRLVVGGADGSTGVFQVTTYLNAALETESHDGAANDSTATAQSLEGSMISLNSGGTGGQQPARGAVLGSLEWTTVATVFSADFETGEQGFSVDNDPANAPPNDWPYIPGFWHLTTGRGSETGHSASTSFYYGTGEGADGGGSYQSGTTDPSYGAIISPAIALPATDNLLLLDFNYLLATRGYPYDVDFATLEIDAGAGWTTLQHYDRVAESAEWRVSDPVDVTAYAGQSVQFRWMFDTRRGPVGCSPEGWYVDDVRIREVSLADYYSFDLKSGQTATIGLVGQAGGEAVFSLISPSGQKLALSSDDAATNFDAVVSDFVVASTGKYFVRVSGDLGTTYSLVVTRNADFETETNNSIETADDLLAAEVGGARWAMGSLDVQIVNVDAFDAGWYLGGYHRPWDINYTTGYFPEYGEFRDFFAFDLTALANEGRVAKATFNVFAANLVTEDEFESLQLVDVTTPVDEVVAGGPDALSIFEDLGTGKIYATRDVFAGEAWTTISIELNAHAIADINAALGGQFALGGRETTIDVEGPQQNIFGASDWWPGGAPQLALTLADSDFYHIAADGNKTIEIETSTPAWKSGEFGNELDPMIRLYDAAGNLLATNDNGASDGRNAKLSYKVPKNGGGSFYVEVSASSVTAMPTRGEYFLSVKGANAPATPFVVTAANPADGDRLYSPPAEMTVDVNDAILLPTLQGADLKIDGVPAGGVTPVDGDTAAFAAKFAYAHSGHYYVLTSGATNWEAAENQAVALGGHLAAINDQAESDFLQHVFFSGPVRYSAYWIGLNDADAEGMFVWSNGDPVSFTNWGYGEPNHSGNEDYVALNAFYNLAPGLWNDTNSENYGNHLFGIIEIAALPSGYVLATEGTHTVSIASGAFQDVQSTPIQPFASTFVLDYTAPRIDYISIAPDAALPEGYQDLVVTIGFSEAIDEAAVNISDIMLAGSYPSAIAFNEYGNELTVSFFGIYLTEGLNELTLASGEYGFHDLVGLNLDGEYGGALPSGNGVEGGDFAFPVSVDAGTRQILVPLFAINPLGSLIYTSPSAAFGFISPGSDTDDWTIDLDANQTISLRVLGLAGLTPTVELIGPNGTVFGSATGTGPNVPLLLQTVAASEAGTYTIRMGSAGGSTGIYDTSLMLNSALEEEEFGGPSNNELPAAQSIDGSFIELAGGADRGAVVGRTETDLVGGIAEVEPNNDFDSAQNLDGGPWSLNYDPYIEESTYWPHISVTGTGDGSFDYYSFTLTNPYQFADFDIDLTSQLNAWLEIYDSAGNLLESSDDSDYDPGSSTSLDSRIYYFFNEPGTYFVRVASYGQAPVPDGATYTLQVSLSGHPVTVSSASDYYSISLDASQSATIVVTSLFEGNVDIALLDGNGAIIATGNEAGANISEIIEFAGGAAGTYYLQVSGDAGVDYSLVVTRSATFDAENNDSMATAQVLDLSTGTATVLGRATPFTPLVFDAFSSGWYRQTGDHSSGNPNYFTGYAPGYGELRGFWAFDLAGLSSDTNVLDARFEVYNPEISTYDYWESIALYDVSTPVSEVVADASGRIDIFDDLGSGTLFGARDVYYYEYPTLISIDLTDDAIVAILASAGEDYAIGAALTSIDFSGGEQNLFGYSGAVGDPRRLVLDVNESDYYQFSVGEGQVLNAEIALPGDGGGEFYNGLVPRIELYDNVGTLVAAVDGAGNPLTTDALPAGLYFLRVSPLNESEGEYVLSVGLTPSAPVSSANDGEAESSPHAMLTESIAAYPWSNRTTPADVSNDGYVTPKDALLIINSLSAEGSRNLPRERSADSSLPYYDVNRDGFLSPLDALLVINYLNRRVEERWVTATPPSVEPGPAVVVTTTPLPAPPTTESLLSTRSATISDWWPVSLSSTLEPESDSGAANSEIVKAKVWSDPEIGWLLEDLAPDVRALLGDLAGGWEGSMTLRERLFSLYGRGDQDMDL